MLIVQTDKDPTDRGLAHLAAPLGNGWGGRKLTDDVVDLALTAVFGDPFGDARARHARQLTTDNVGDDSPNITSTFPYLAPPN